MESEPLTAAELEVLAELGRWEWSFFYPATPEEKPLCPCCLMTEGEGHQDDCEFVAARNALPRLLTAAGEAARLRERVAWLPIETAPRDGTHFLAAERYGEVHEVWWREDVAAFGAVGWSYGFDSGPTHWQPLPPPPAPSPRLGTPEGVGGG